MDITNIEAKAAGARAKFASAEWRGMTPSARGEVLIAIQAGKFVALAKEIEAYAATQPAITRTSRPGPIVTLAEIATYCRESAKCCDGYAPLSRPATAYRDCDEPRRLLRKIQAAHEAAAKR